MPRITDHKFFEIIKPDSNYEFIGRSKYWIGLSIVLTAAHDRHASAQCVRHQGPRSRPELGRRLPRRQRDHHRVLEAGRRRRGAQDPGRGPASTTPTWSSTGTRPARSSGTTWCASAPCRSSPSSRSKQVARVAGQGRRGVAQALRVVGGRRQDLPALRQAGRADGARELAQGDRRQHDAGAAVRPRRRPHLRSDAGRPRQRDPAGARRPAGRGRGRRDPQGRVGRRQGRQAAAVRRRPVAAATRSC